MKTVRKKIVLCIAVLFSLFLFVSCGSDKAVKIGVSIGAGPAARWDQEKNYMEEQAENIGADIEVRLNRTDEPKTQKEDCMEMIDSGIDALILMPRTVTDVQEILDYAKKKKVPIISYARAVASEDVRLFVGYDSKRIGQKLGQYITELVYNGDYIVLHGDPTDNNAALLYSGSMEYISGLGNNINIILDAAIPGWNPETAKEMVKEAVAANNNHVDAILSPNDKIAGACTEALKELGVTAPVVITGMDTELDAVKRILVGEQSCTIYMDLKELASTAVNEAYHMAKGEKVNINSTFENQKGHFIDANLITGQLVIKENVDDILIDSGYFTKEEVYGK